MKFRDITKGLCLFKYSVMTDQEMNIQTSKHELCPIIQNSLLNFFKNRRKYSKYT